VDAGEWNGERAEQYDCRPCENHRHATQPTAENRKRRKPRRGPENSVLGRWEQRDRKVGSDGTQGRFLDEAFVDQLCKVVGYTFAALT
jgi:hypothetical protein